MTTATYHHNDGLRHYFTDVGNAARAFAAALFAARERQFVAQEVVAKPTVSERARMKSYMKILSLASQYEATSPNLAAELRHLAARG
jgi:hypothetical protein